jgi:hypothetical protein
VPKGCCNWYNLWDKWEKGDTYSLIFNTCMWFNTLVYMYFNTIETSIGYIKAHM